MAKHLQTGVLGESAATEWLEQKGWRIAERNWRANRGEIDIIAWAGERLLVFVEVKTRSGSGAGFGGPEDAISAAKQALLLRTAGLYMESISYEWEIRFDVITIQVESDKTLKINHIEDAFYPFS